MENVIENNKLIAEIMDLPISGKTTTTKADQYKVQQLLFDSGNKFPLNQNNLTDLSSMARTDNDIRIYWNNGEIIHVSKFSDIDFDKLPYPMMNF